MADPHLSGNGMACAACEGTGVVPYASGAVVGVTGCQICATTGRVAIPPDLIIAAQLAENRKGPA